MWTCQTNAQRQKGEARLITANRFDEIKTFAKELHGTPVTDICLADIGKMLVAIDELSAELDRIRSVPTIRNSGGHVKPLVLGPDGAPVMGPPLAQQFAAERRQQYDEDRVEALSDENPDPKKWRTFALRWGLAPPPGGWDNTNLIIITMHRLRMEVDAVPYILKHASAVTLKANGIALPHGYRLQDGELHVPAKPPAL